MDFWYDESHAITLYKSTNFTSPFLKTWMDSTSGYEIDKIVRLIPTVRPSIVSPEMRESSIEIPGHHGVLDLSEFLTGYPIYQNRTGEIKYIIVGYVDNDWHKTCQFFLHNVHNKKFYIVLDDDPDYYYYGRLKCAFEQANDGSYNALTLTYDLDPIKWAKEYYVSARVTDAVNAGDFHLINKVGNVVTPYEGIVPTILEVSRTTTASTGASVAFKNPELGIDCSVPLAGNVDQWVSSPELVLSNLSGNNVCSIRWAGMFFKYRYRRGEL